MTQKNLINRSFFAENGDPEGRHVHDWFDMEVPPSPPPLPDADRADYKD